MGFYKKERYKGAWSLEKAPSSYLLSYRSKPSYSYFLKKGNIILYLIFVDYDDWKKQYTTYTSSETDYFTEEGKEIYEILKREHYPVVVGEDGKIRLELPGRKATKMTNLLKKLFNKYGILI